jgi:hypothetical protein
MQKQTARCRANSSLLSSDETSWAVDLAALTGITSTWARLRVQRFPEIEQTRVGAIRLSPCSQKPGEAGGVV